MVPLLHYELGDGIYFAAEYRKLASSVYKQQWEKEAKEDHVRAAIARPSRGKDDYATVTIRNTSTEPLAGKLTADVLDNATGLSVLDASAAPARAAEVQGVSTRLSAVRLLRYASGTGAIMPSLISNCT